jgi:ribosomal protein S18 acetylase RimI-like enzyme
MPSLLPELVRFWNRSFVERRNFFPVTGHLLRERVIEKETFDPRGFIVAREGRKIAGIVHVGIRREAACRLLDPKWSGGTQGYVAFLFVDPARRRQGIGTELWRRGLDRLRGTRQVVVDGRCLNPFYGNSEGPFTPFWGTPEGVSVDWEDSGTQKFLARKGFVPRFRAFHLAMDLAGGLPRLPPSSQFRTVVNSYPELGRPFKERRAVATGIDYEVVTAVRAGRTVAIFSFYPLSEVRQGLFAVYEASVVEKLRGRALGRRLLDAGLERMRSRGASQVEVLTVPELSPVTHKRYLAACFRKVASWAIY